MQLGINVISFNSYNDVALGTNLDNNSKYPVLSKHQKGNLWTGIECNSKIITRSFPLKERQQQNYIILNIMFKEHVLAILR